MKKILIALLSLAGVTTLNINGAGVLAMGICSGPTIPKMMFPGEEFEKLDKSYQLLDHKTTDIIIESSNPHIIKVTIADDEKGFLLEALQPGEATITITKKKSGKVKETRLVTVAYAQLSDLPNSVEHHKNIYIHTTKNAPAITSNLTASHVYRKRIGKEYYFEIRFRGHHEITLKQGNKEKTISVNHTHHHNHHKKNKNKRHDVNVEA